MGRLHALRILLQIGVEGLTANTHRMLEDDWLVGNFILSFEVLQRQISPSIYGVTLQPAPLQGHCGAVPGLIQQIGVEPLYFQRPSFSEFADFVGGPEEGLLPGVFKAPAGFQVLLLHSYKPHDQCGRVGLKQSTFVVQAVL